MNLRRPLAVSTGFHFFVGLLLWLGIVQSRPTQLKYYAVDFLGGGRPSASVPPQLTPSRPKRRVLPNEWALPSRKHPPAAEPRPPSAPVRGATKPSLPTSTTQPGQGGAGGGEGGGIGIGFGPGSGVGMGLPNFPYAWYVNILRTKLWEEWSRWVPPGSQQNCLVTFVIQRSGAVTAIELERTSGDPLFDQGALRAIQTAAPFPPLPEGFQDPTLSVHVEFRLGT